MEELAHLSEVRCLQVSQATETRINEFLESGINEKLPNCTKPNLVGNGICDPDLNIIECDFDGNDCAMTTTSTSTSTITTCPDWSKANFNDIFILN